MNIHIGLRTYPPEIITGIAFDAESNHVTVWHDDGEQSGEYSTTLGDPFQIQDVREFIAAHPDLVKQVLPASEAVEMSVGSFQEAEAFAEIFVKSEHILDHESVQQAMDVVGKKSSNARGTIHMWHISACKRRYLATGQDTCCYGSREQAQEDAVLANFGSGAGSDERHWY